MNTHISKKTLNKANLHSKEVNDFKKNLKNDFKKKSKVNIKKNKHSSKIKNVSKNSSSKKNNIQQLSNKDILNMIKNDK